MVKIVIPNHNLDSQRHQLIFDSCTNSVSNTKGETLDKTSLLIPSEEFVHPLLCCKPLCIEGNKVNVDYSDYDELFEMVRRVYSTMIHSDSPDSLVFRFTPSTNYVTRKPHQALYVSLYPQTAAKEQVTIMQLNKMMTDIYSQAFNYVDTVIVEGEIPVTSFPKQINADELFEAQADIVHYLKQVPNYDHLEIRFIGADIGFGVFCRQKINQDSIVAMYAGKKCLSTDVKSRFRFGEVDVMNSFLDATTHGNMTRFINHAAKDAFMPDQDTANLLALSHKLYGINVTVFYARREIKPGEQLLFQYKENPFKEDDLYFFKHNYQLYDSNDRRVKKNPADKITYAIFAKHNLHQAKRYFLIKPTIVLILSILFLVGLTLF